MYITPMKFYYSTRLGRSVKKPIFKDKAMDNYIEGLRPSEYFDLIRENPFALVDARKGLLFTNPNIFAYIDDTPYHINLYGMLIKCRNDELLKKEKNILPDVRKLEIWDTLAFNPEIAIALRLEFNPNAQIKGFSLIELALGCEDKSLARYLMQNKNFVPAKKFYSEADRSLYNHIRAEIRAIKTVGRLISHVC